MKAIGGSAGDRDSQTADQKLLTKYGISISRQQRARRRQVGQANLRLKRDWIILATKGEHRFFAEERASIQDARHIPIQIGVYSVRVARGQFLKKEEGRHPDSRYRARVQISREKYLDLRAHLLYLACHRPAENLAAELWKVSYEPYAPIRRQLLNALRLINKSQERSGIRDA